MVSIITPAYNADKFIKFSIESVLMQSYQDWEMIIIDDCSTDDTIKIVKSYHDIRIKLIVSDTKLFTAGARNLGIMKAQGNYIAFLDSDDFWHRDKLQKQISLMFNSKAFFAYTGVNKINNKGKELGNISVPESLKYNNLLRGNKICCSSVIIDIKAIKDLKFNIHYVIHEDYALWLKIFRSGSINAVGINEPLTFYRVHNDGKTNNKLMVLKWAWKIFRESEEFSFTKSSISFFFYAIEGLKKYIV